MINRVRVVSKNQFKVENRGTYIYLKTWGDMQLDGLEKPAEAAIALAKEGHVDRLLDNIQEVESSVSFPVQLKGVRILWKLRVFKKVAVVLKRNELGGIFFSSLSALKMSDGGAFKGFSDEAEAIAWLNSDEHTGSTTDT